ncbi:MAG TPA: hypothetical protein VH164_06325 [Ktedonobacteraceae bacterium]|nr:hypothetical protein [Ktedonobacteraceae bacterium]
MTNYFFDIILFIGFACVFFKGVEGDGAVDIDPIEVSAQRFKRLLEVCFILS